MSLRSHTGTMQCSDWHAGVHRLFLKRTRIDRILNGEGRVYLYSITVLLRGITLVSTVSGHNYFIRFRIPIDLQVLPSLLWIEKMQLT